ncbi:tRNA 2-thiouridine(34) synthase MnmA [Heliophilum fasciatum]|uniref:tRNA-specific 2-thiouridylase MnmA n=1 Tax=Heliophilum fasciatum TaxID=35700 RepID=A0A4V2SX09_9FIRM|nr:tRNA 2-thiouridine(34) synthase MnmA [Heliophilum fasciatum]MCW2278044.1 tRNA-specific 2-thiouridylase [Heliophilum fasciatum]TCP64336.1 tRNA (5-methylaminomethyl-2-thiouridylate)-methyltransferase [Heliophilum fasciatum]
MQETVVVAMSGGVDSSVTAALLLEQGYNVIGVTMQIWPSDMPADESGGCCSLATIQDARRVADQLGIPHYVVNFRDRFEEAVIGSFSREYLAGRTPNPCIVCNRVIKFEQLLTKALGLGAQKLATGHYARIDVDPETGRYRLGRAEDQRKDQSYFLYMMNQHQLAHTLFPVASFTKPEIRARAAQLGFQIAEKPDSQEICFVPDNDYRQFLRRRFPEEQFAPGPFLSTGGQVLGMHQGLPFYTVGQRKGLGIALGFPAYVVALDPERNAVIIGTDRDVYAPALEATELTWIDEKPLQGPREVLAKIRYAAKPAAAVVHPLGPDRVRVEFASPQRAITPGQAVVFYHDDWVLGGGTIDKSC